MNKNIFRYIACLVALSMISAPVASAKEYWDQAMDGIKGSIDSVWSSINGNAELEAAIDKFLNEANSYSLDFGMENSMEFTGTYYLSNYIYSEGYMDAFVNPEKKYMRSSTTEQGTERETREIDTTMYYIMDDGVPITYLQERIIDGPSAKWIKKSEKATASFLSSLLDVHIILGICADHSKEFEYAEEYSAEVERDAYRALLPQSVFEDLLKLINPKSNTSEDQGFDIMGFVSGLFTTTDTVKVALIFDRNSGYLLEYVLDFSDIMLAMAKADLPEELSDQGIVLDSAAYILYGSIRDVNAVEDFKVPSKVKKNAVEAE